MIRLIQKQILENKRKKHLRLRCHWSESRESSDQSTMNRYNFQYNIAQHLNNNECMEKSDCIETFKYFVRYSSVETNPKRTQ